MSGYYAYSAYCRHTLDKSNLKSWKNLPPEEREVWEKIADEIAVQAFANISDSLSNLKQDINDVIKKINTAKGA